MPVVHINIAQLADSIGGRCRFLWKDGGTMAAMMRYNYLGTYTGSCKVSVGEARDTWRSLVKRGWKRVKPKSGIGEALTPNDQALAINLD